MDPLSQGVAGSLATQLFSQPKKLLAVSVVGFLAGMAADLDVLIQSSSDPLLGLEFHRHFTHSLVFIPIGGLLCAFVFYVVYCRHIFSFKQTWFFSTLGYGTHALLDACTSYGTLLLWPFSTSRIAWNNIAVIDPLFTLPVLLLVIVAVIKKSRGFSVAALVYAFSYLFLGVALQHKASNVVAELAASRGHSVTDAVVKPSFGNLVLWKSVYLHNDVYYIDAVRVVGKVQVIEGESHAKLNMVKDLPWLLNTSQQADDLKRFSWFSGGYLAVSKHDPYLIIDMRYSLLPNSADGLWGIKFNPQAEDNEHVEMVSLNRDRDSSRESLPRLWQMIRYGK